MNKSIVIILLATAVLTGACSKKKGGSAKLKADTDSVAYVIGMNVGMNLMKMDSTMNFNVVCEGIRDAFNGASKMSMEDAQAFYLRYINYSLPEKVRAYEERFLEDILKSNRSYARTSSGVTYTVDEVGNQELIPTSDRDSVVMRYVIRSSDGDEIYSSYERGDSVRSAMGDLKRGVQESLKLIGKGGRIKTWMPAATAYGADGDKQLGVRPNTTLYYEIELIGVDKYSNRVRRNN